MSRYFLMVTISRFHIRQCAAELRLRFARRRYREYMLFVAAAGLSTSYRISLSAVAAPGCLSGRQMALATVFLFRAPTIAFIIKEMA